MSLPDVLTVDQDFLPLLFSLIFQFITLHKENILHRPAYWATIKTLELNVLMNEHYSSQLENLKILKKIVQFAQTYVPCLYFLRQGIFFILYLAVLRLRETGAP